MREAARLAAEHEWAMRLLDEQEFTAAAAGNAQTLLHLKLFRDSLNRGFYVLLFGQFEVELQERFRRRRDLAAVNPDWRERRGWDVPTLQGSRVPFETMLALMLDRNGVSHRKIMTAFSHRNHCAHGGTAEPIGSIGQLVKDLYVWQGELRRG
jgi:hypothetical protein